MKFTIDPPELEELDRDFSYHWCYSYTELRTAVIYLKEFPFDIGYFEREYTRDYRASSFPEYNSRSPFDSADLTFEIKSINQVNSETEDEAKKKSS